MRRRRWRGGAEEQEEEEKEPGDMDMGDEKRVRRKAIRGRDRVECRGQG
jgi:hypothetical protein